MALPRRNGHGRLYGFPIDIRIPYTARSLSGRPFRSSWTLLAIGRNYGGDIILIVCRLWFTLKEGKPSIGGDRC